VAEPDNTRSLATETKSPSPGAVRSTEPINDDDDDAAPFVNVGDCLARYTVRARIGAGGMGVVFAAHDAELDRLVALKILRPHVAGPSLEARARFQREAQAMARLSHPNVVSVFDVGAVGEHVFVAMELVPGPTLADWLAQARRTWREIAAVFLQAGRGLEAAHDAGIVHRDFKPSNVIVGDRVRVADFGLARGLKDPHSIAAASTALTGDVTMTGQLLGTPAYMAPEQRAGLVATPLSDQYSFAVALREALVGVRAVPGRLRAAVARALQQRPEDRFPSLRPVLDELARDPARARWRWLAGAGVVALAAGAVVMEARRDVDGAPACGAAASALDGVWRPERRQGLAAVFATLADPGLESWRRVDATLDDWAGRWRALRVEVCRAGGASAAPALLARQECLERRLHEMDGLLAALAQPDRTIAHYAGAAAHALTAPESCLGALPTAAEAGPPPLPQALAGVRARVDDATALRRLGKPRPGLDEARAAADEADKLAWPPLVAEAQLALGDAHLGLRATSDAENAYYRALWSAEASRDDALRFSAVLALSSVGIHASMYPLAARWLEMATVIAGLLPPSADRAADLAQQATRLAHADQRVHDCVTHGEDSVAKAEQAGGAESPRVIAALLILGECHHFLKEPDVAGPLLERALALSEKVNGHDHPQTAVALAILGARARQTRDYAGALARYGEALAVREKLLGPDNPDCAAIRNNIANVLRDLGRYDEARDQLERAAAIWTQAWGPDSPALTTAFSGLGTIERLQGKLRAAEDHYRRALEIIRKKRPLGHPEVVGSVAKLAGILLDEKSPEAIPLLEEALAGIEHDPDATATDRAEARFALGRGRFELAVDRAAGLALATASCQELDTAATRTDFAECQTWLTAHRGTQR
jgi:eukaryotic-like serine/threonine-protein kinase